MEAKYDHDNKKYSELKSKLEKELRTIMNGYKKNKNGEKYNAKK